MATISTLAVRLLLDTTAFAGNAVKSASVMGRLSNTLQEADSGLARVAQQADVLATGFERVNASARGYLRTLAAVGGGSVVLARSIKAYADAQAREREVSRNAGGERDVVILADAWARLRSVVDGAYVTFGRAFAQTANLQESLRIVNSVIERTQPLVNAIGLAFGTFWNLIVNFPPVLLILSLATQATGFAVKLLASIIVTKLVVAFATWLILGRALTPMQLALMVIVKAKTVAMWAYTASVYAYNIAISVATASTRGFLIVSGVVLGTLGMFAAAVYGLYQAWKYLTGAPMRLEAGGAVEDLEKVKEQVEDIDEILEKARERVRTFGWSEQQKELDKLQKRLGEDKPDPERGYFGLLPHEAAQKQVELQEEQAKEASLKRQADLKEKLEKLRQRALDAARTEGQQAVAELRALGASAEQLAQAQAYVSAQESATKSLAEKEQLVKTLADLEREAATARMSELEKQIYLAEQLGAREQDIARIRAAQAQIDSANAAKEKAKQQERDLKHLKDEVARMEKGISTPIEDFQKKIADITRLLAVGAIDQKFANRAVTAAEKQLAKDLGKDDRFRLESPKALLRHTDEARLAENRAKNPVETLTEIEREQLAEAQKASQLLTQAIPILSKMADVGKSILVNF